MRFEIVAHLARSGAVDVLRRTLTALEGGGHACTLRIPEGLGSAPAPQDLDTVILPMPLDGGPDVAADTDLVISLGGDGTFLRAARLARAVDVPVIGVNVGRLGFLAEIDPQDLEASLASLTAGAFVVEERSTLELELRGADGVIRDGGWALNDVAVEKEARQRLVRLEIAIGPTLFASMAADAVIVATSTGSTAYALSAGGPIVNPTLDAMLIAPVAPHSLFDRTVVTDLADTVTITVGEDQDGALVSTDGMDPSMLGPGDVVVVRGGAKAVRVARVGEGEFFARVRRTFRLG